MTSAHIGRELAATRAEDLHRQAARGRLARVSAGAGRAAPKRAAAPAAPRAAGWLGRLATAALRH